MTPDLRWLARLFRRHSLANQSREEMRFHVDEAVADLVHRGVPEAEARRRVRLEIGEVEVETERLGDHRPGAMLESLGRDLRLAVRALRRSPMLSVVTVLLVAIGIAASTSIFTIVDRVLLRPLPLPGADRIVRLHESNPALGVPETGVSRGNLADWRTRARSFDGMAAAYTPSRTLGDGDRVEVLTFAQVSCDYFRVVGLAPVLGETFSADQCRAARFSSAAAPISSDPVVMLTRRHWMDRYAGDPAVIGRTVLVDRRPFRVIGIAPDESTVPLPGAQAFLPWELEQSLPFDQRYTVGIARVRDGVTLATARTEIDRIATELAGERPRTNRDWGVTVTPLQEEAVRALRPVLVTLLAAAGLLLCIACANVALLLSARGLARAHEGSLHLALGGSAGRLLRQGLLETGLLALAGGVVGVAASFATVRYLRSAWLDLPRSETITPDARVLLFAVLATLVAAAIAGWLPAMRHARTQPIDALRGGRRATGGRREGRGRNLLVTAEVALTVVLLAGAGLLIRSVDRLQSSATGFDANDVTVLPVFLDSERYNTGAATQQYYRDLFTRLRALPGVVAVGGATALPTSEYGPNFDRPAWPLARAGDPGAVRPASVRIVTPGYFDVLRIPLRQGRAFDERDGPDAPRVIVVSERLARSHWPAGNAVGQQLVVDYASAGTYPYEVIGVVGDLRFRGPRTEPLEEVYFPHAQRAYLILNVALRSTPGAAPTTTTLQSVLREVDPQKPPQGIYRLQELLSATWRREQWAMQLLAGFAAVAMLLAALGIYGTLAFRVREARRDIGVRVALGATPTAVAGWVAGEVGRVLLAGAAVGFLVAAIAARFIRALLYGVAPYDPWTGLAVLALLVVVGGLAAGLPAWRASRVDPVTALRVD